MSLVVIISCSKKELELPYYNGPDFNPIWPSEGGDTTNLHRIGSFQFVNQNGDEISEKSYKGKIYVVNFVFTSCGSICPKMTNHLKGVQENLKEHHKELRFLSHTVMPWVDTPDKLKEYANDLKLNLNNWDFVTGTKSKLYEIARKEYFIEEEPGFSKDSSEFLHTEHFALIDKNSHIRGLYNGTLQLEMEKLESDILKLLKE